LAPGSAHLCRKDTLEQTARFAAESASAPVILGGGFWRSAFSSSCGGVITPMLVALADPGGALAVDVSCAGARSAMELRDDGMNGDLAAGDGIFRASFSHVRFVPPQAYLLEFSVSGDETAQYPYLIVD